MKINEIIMSEMAGKRKYVKDKVNELSGPILEHLIKILKWRDIVHLNKHMVDIDDWIKQVQSYTLKGSNDRPNQHEYYSWTYNDDFTKDARFILRKISSLRSHYGDLKPIRSDDEVEDIIRNIMYQLSYELPSNDNIHISKYLEPYISFD